MLSKFKEQGSQHSGDRQTRRRVVGDEVKEMEQDGGSRRTIESLQGHERAVAFTDGTVLSREVA